MQNDPNGNGVAPTNYLINGKGTIRESATTNSKSTSVPLEVFRVTKGQRYRFRLITSVSHACPVALEIENHSMLIIASDSYNLKPVTVNSLTMNAGERYDIVIDANQDGGKFFRVGNLKFGFCLFIPHIFILKTISGSKCMD